MKALIDANIIIDALQHREGFTDDAELLILQAYEYDGYITTTSVTDIYYIQRKYYHDREKAIENLKKVFRLYSIIDVTETDCRNALRNGMSDYEDAIIAESVRRNGIDCIVARNTKCFKNAGIAVYTPVEFLRLLKKAK